MLTHNHNLTFLPCISKEIQNTNLKEYMHLYVHCNIVYSSRALEATQMPIMDEWIEKLWHVYTTELLPGHKKNKILPVVTAWVDPEDIILSEISQAEKDKYHMISLICGI